MKIALVSLNQIWEDKNKNLELCISYIKEAKNEDAEVIIFPEMTLTGFSMNIDKTAEAEDANNSLREFQKIACENEVAIIFGMVIKDNEKAKNRAYFIDKSGEILASYDKIHPFSFAGEDKYFNGGDKVCQFKFNDITLGLTICYDLRFPELYTILSKECDLILNIANWPEKRLEHWEALLKARAIENQIYMVGVNRTGKDGNDLDYCESSKMYDANGKEIFSKSIENLKIIELELESKKEFLKTFSTTQDKKIEIYKEYLCQ